MKEDMFGQEINVGDYVCCTTSTRGSTRMYIGKVDKITERRVRVTTTNGDMHQKSFDKVFVVTEQIMTIPELMI